LIWRIFCRHLHGSEKQKNRFYASEKSSRSNGPAKRQNAAEKWSVQSAIKFLSLIFPPNLR
jgi:hypothetical protein